MAEIDTLQVKITANAQSATAALKSLSSALQKVRTALTGMKDGVSVSDHLSKSLNQMNGALNTINTGSIKKLQKLANALNDYSDAVKRIKGNGANISRNIQNVSEALTPRNEGIISNKTDDVGEQIEKVAPKISLVHKLSAEMARLGQRIQEAGLKAKKSGTLVGRFFKSLGRIAFYRAIRSALKAINEAFTEGLKNAYYYAQQNNDLSNLAQTLDNLKSKTQQMINQLGAFWGEIKQFVAPALEWIADKIREIASYLTELFAALNGDTYYQRAVYEEVKWDDAADALKDYKHQLLGLDELNNLSKQKDSNKKSDYLSHGNDFEDVLVRPEFQKIGNTWQSVKKSVEDAFDSIYSVLFAPFAMAAIGAILLFTGHPFLGLGLLVAGCAWGVAEIMINWDELREEVKKAFKKYKKLFAIGAVGAIAVGAILMFTGHYLLGLSLIVAGGVLGVADIIINWDELRGEVKKAFKKYGKLFAIGAVGAIALGAILIFTGHYLLGITALVAGSVLGIADVVMNWSELRIKVKKAFKKYAPLFALGAVGAIALGAILLFTGHYLLGLTALVAGGVLGAATITLSWTELKTNVKKAFKKFAPLFAAVGVGSMVVGALLLFTGNIPLGLGLLIGGGFLTAETIAFNWDDLLKSLKSAWENIKLWWNGTVKPKITGAVEWVEEKLNIDLNGDGTKGTPTVTVHKSSSGAEHGGTHGKFDETTITGDREILGGALTVKEGSITDKILDWVDSITHKAAGGIVQQGSLFFAGESGAEFVGNIGSTSAVANTGQMTEAIRQAAYMGISQALKENGGNGMSGFVPATTDDLFIAIKRKANNYTKTTGSPAFG